MTRAKNAVGQAVFIRTDVPEYEEECISFGSLEEMIDVCTTAREHLTLDKVMIYAMDDDAPVSLSLGFIAASKGRRLPVELLRALEER